MQAAIIQDPYEKELRYRQLKKDMEWFSKELFRIHCLMPVKFTVNISTGEFTHLIEPEWQKLIDGVVELRDAFVKSNYPEFYQTGIIYLPYINTKEQTHITTK